MIHWSSLTWRDWALLIAFFYGIGFLWAINKTLGMIFGQLEQMQKTLESIRDRR